MSAAKMVIMIAAALRDTNAKNAGVSDKQGERTRV
jgi:hypothetical protein